MELSTRPPMDGQWNAGPPPSTFPQSSTNPSLPFNRGRSRGRGRGRATVDRDTCRICFGRNHWSYSCPYNQNQPTSAADADHINGVSDSSNYCKSYTYFTVVMDGVKVSMLLDSGSQRNLIPKRLVRMSEVKQCNTTNFLLPMARKLMYWAWLTLIFLSMNCFSLLK